MAQCIQCRKARKLKKGLCKACRNRQADTIPSFENQARNEMSELGLPEDEMDNMLEDLTKDLNK